MRAVGISIFRLLFTLPVLLAVLCAFGCAADQSAPPAQPVVVTPSAPPLAPAEVLITESSPATNGATPSSEIIPIETTDATWGMPTAPVTIVAFVDLQCPFCARVLPTLEKLQNEYGPQRLRLVVKHLPLAFHPQARPAAEAAQAVMAMRGPGAFFRFVTLLYQRQQELGPALFESAAGEIGLPPRALSTRAAAADVRAQVEAHLELAERVGVQGTPGFRINGILLSGAQPYEKFREIVEAELAATNQARQAGTPPERIYAARVAANFTLPPKPKNEPYKPDPPDEKVYRVLVGQSPAIGPRDALVTIVEFQDLQCPFCKRVQPTLQQIRERYPNDVRIVFKHNPLPFHPRALPAAQLAIEARALKGDGGFWKAVESLFGSAPELEDEHLLKLARELGLNEARAKKAIARTKHPQIELDQELAMDFQARGTPHFFINGRRLSGAQPLESFTSLIDAELEKARRLIADKKLPRAAVYDAIMKTAEGPSEPEKKSVTAPPANQPSRGAAGAPVVIQIFSDFQCPFCQRVRPTIEEIEKKYPGRVRLVWRDLPLDFHRQARQAAEAAREAFAQKGSKGFWAMHDLLFENQQTPDGLELPALETYAQNIGLDLTRFRAALADDRHAAAIDADLTAAKAADIRGTPSFVINGYYVSGAQPLRTFSRIVDRSLLDLQRPKRAAK
jgi:protein-disulfide isomerase